MILEKIDIMDKDKICKVLHCTIQSKIPDEDRALSKLVADGCGMDWFDVSKIYIAIYK